MMKSDERGLYLHIPFCLARCHFCAFYLQIYQKDRAAIFVDSLLHEIHLYADRNPFEGRPLTSIYFGGGTPTTLPSTHLIRILSEVRRAFYLNPDVEITIEAHPDTVTRESLAQLFDAGFNRISLGVQSLHDKELIAIGRPAKSGTAQQALMDARSAGFTNINLDLIYGLLGQSLNSWRADVQRIVDLKPTHLSCYALTIESGTHLQRDVERDKTLEPDEELQIAMEQEGQALFAAAGFRRYEISNYARPGCECRHNLLYWTAGEYLGLGPSAQSYVQGDRFGNVDNLQTYTHMLEANRIPVSAHDRLDVIQQHREAVVFGLRLIEGVPRPLVDSQDWSIESNQVLTRLIGEGLLEDVQGRLRMTTQGRRFADSIAVSLL
ncbi:MAG: radical SAM family heme chaperone HemW [Nitrospiraceae bacterium]